VETSSPPPRSNGAEDSITLNRRWRAETELNIENNAAERALRPVGIGRKNWLFAGHDKAAQRAATLYTLIATAERHGLDPQTYLRGVLALIPATSIGQLDRFLPDRYHQ